MIVQVKKGSGMVAGCSANVIHPEAVSAGKGMLPRRDELEGMEAFFKVLGDSTRLRILHALLAGELCVCDLGETLSMSVSAVSHQLAVLKTARLVRNRRDGKVVYYSLSDDHVTSLLESMRTHLSEGSSRE
jgi:ArsR family transcriptional regulator, lead/cadmium/zinc/bismuth-responsive transcriptional repressor